MLIQVQAPYFYLLVLLNICHFEHFRQASAKYQAHDVSGKPSRYICNKFNLSKIVYIMI